MEAKLLARAENQCELTKSEENLTFIDLSVDGNSNDLNDWVVLTEACKNNLGTPNEIDTNIWRSLSESIWSPFPAVQIAAYRVLTLLSRSGETWATELLESMYLDDEMLTWARANLPNEEDIDNTPKDSNGVTLSSGDTVTLIKDLNVKGTSFTAKRGTTVKNISVSDDVRHIEGRINGQRIVIIAEYTKKS